MKRDMSQSEKLQRTLRIIVSLLVGLDFERLASLTRGIRLSADDMRRAVAEYGRTLVMPPGPEIDADVVEVTGSRPTRWSVVVPLYTREEGPSDLSLELSLVDSDADQLEVAIDDLHVR